LSCSSICCACEHKTQITHWLPKALRCSSPLHIHPCLHSCTQQQAKQVLLTYSMHTPSAGAVYGSWCMHAPRQGAETAGEADWTQPTPASLCSLQAGTCCQQCPPVGQQPQLAAQSGPTGRMAAMMVMPCHWLHYPARAHHARRSSTQPAPADKPQQAAMDAAQAL